MSNIAYTYEECFALLGVTADVTWSELRRAYRRQLQKWHPDKVRYNNIDLKIAENKFNAIQTAFTILEKYYLTHETLPPILTHSDITSPTKNSKQANNTAKVDYTLRNRGTSSHSGSKGIFPTSFFVLLTLGAVIYFFLNYIYQEANVQSIEIPAQNETQPTSVDKSTESIQPSQSHAPVKRTFGFGTSMLEVKEIQGPPSHQNGNIWFYGKSYVIFSNGIVTDWFQHESSPLNIKQTNSAPKVLSTFNQPKKIQLGMTKSEVMAIQGEPMQDLVDVWVYGNSKIYFKNGHVVSWINSTLDPLKLE